MILSQWPWHNHYLFFLYSEVSYLLCNILLRPVQLPDTNTSTLWGSWAICALLGASIASLGQAARALHGFGKVPPAVKPATLRVSGPPHLTQASFAKTTAGHLCSNTNQCPHRTLTFESDVQAQYPSLCLTKFKKQKKNLFPLLAEGWDGRQVSLANRIGRNFSFKESRLSWTLPLLIKDYILRTNCNLTSPNIHCPYFSWWADEDKLFHVWKAQKSKIYSP